MKVKACCSTDPKKQCQRSANYSAMAAKYRNYLLDNGLVTKKDDSTYNTVKAKVEAGKTYYAYLGGATAQIWKVYYSQLNKKTVVDWESVAKPVISKVEAGSDGFTVTVEGIVDEYNGAEDIVVTMLHNDGQAGSRPETTSRERMRPVRWTRLSVVPK